MKKRKELNALVSNGKANGKRCGGGGKKSFSSGSAHELLKHDSDTSDLEDFAVRKSRKHGNPLPLSAICLPLCQFVLVTTSILVSGTLIWLHIGLRENLDVLRAHLQKVEGVSKSSPEEFHNIHSKLKDLDSNVSSLFLDIKKNIVDIENATAEIRQLKAATVSLQDSIAAAPTIKQLPKDVSSLSESVVAFGSKITAMENTVKDLKESQSSVQSTTRSLSSEINSIKMTVQDLSNASKTNSTEAQSNAQTIPLVRDLTFQSAIQETKQRVNYLQQELLDLSRAMDMINATFSHELSSLSTLPAKINSIDASVNWIVNDTENHDRLMTSIENYAYSNLTSRLDHLETECSRNTDKPQQYSNVSEILDLVNKTVTDAVVNIVQSDSLGDDKLGNSSKNLVVDTYNGLVFLAGLLKQFNQMAPHELMAEKNVTAIVSNFLNGSIHELMKEHDVKLEMLEGEIRKLSAHLPKLLDNKNHNLTVSVVKDPDAMEVEYDGSTNSPVIP